MSSDALKEVREANQLILHSSSFVALTQLTHGLQKERAQSNLFIGKKISVKDLSQFRIENDRFVEKAKVELHDARLGRASEESWASVETSLVKLRNDIDKGSIGLSQSLAQYTTLIKSILEIQVDLSRTASFQGLESHLLALTIFNTAKESAGLLRGQITSILTTNTVLSPEDIGTLNSLRAGILVNLRSPAMTFSQEGMGEVREFVNSQSWKQALSMVDQIIARSSTGDYGIDAKDSYALMTRSIDAMNDLIIGESTRASEALKTEASAISSRTYTLILVAVIMILVTVVLILKMVQSLVKGIDESMQILHEISEEVATASELLANSSQQVSASTTETAASLEETVASIEELTSIAREMAKRAEEAATLSNDGALKAEEGEVHTDNLVTSMSEINEDSKKIQQILSTIEEIASQTNLLSLNAAVEAARAGEQGKGFAVVAEAVRALAHQSAEAAQNINKLISASVGGIERGTKIVEVSGISLRELGEGIRQVNSLNLEISNASQEQAAGFSQIAAAMNQLDSATQGNAAAAEEVSSLSSQMSNHGQSLVAIVANLNVIIKGR